MDHAEKTHHLEMLDLGAKGWFRGHTQICLALEVAATSDQGRYGIVIEIYSLRNDGSQSCVLISRGMNQYVTEVSEGIREILGGVDASRCSGKTCRERTEGTKNVIIVVLNDDDTVRAKLGGHSSRRNSWRAGLLRLEADDQTTSTRKSRSGRRWCSGMETLVLVFLS